MTSAVEAFTVLPPSGSDKASRTFYGPLGEHLHRLRGYNELGYGVFFTVNGTDGLGRRIENVPAARSLFADYDSGLPATWALEPNLLVESSPGRFQAYWHMGIAATPDFARWQRVMRSLVETTGADANAQDLARIFRVPGFYNHKYSPSFLVTVKRSSSVRYSLDALAAAFGESTELPIAPMPAAPESLWPPESERLKRWKAWLSYRGWPTKGERNGWLFRAAAAGIRDFALEPGLVEVALEELWFARESDDPRLESVIGNASKSRLRGVGCAFLPTPATKFELQPDEEGAPQK